MFDLKTVKPNKGDFISYKRNMLEWLAVFFYQNPKAKANRSSAKLSVKTFLKIT